MMTREEKNKLYASMSKSMKLESLFNKAAKTLKMARNRSLNDRDLAAKISLHKVIEYLEVIDNQVLPSWEEIRRNKALKNEENIK